MALKNNSSEPKIQKHRDDLTGEHASGDAGQFILALLFFVIWILDTFVLKWTTFLNAQISLWVRLPFGLILLAVGGYLASDGMKIVFGEPPSAIPAVIRKGVFSIVRHPIYLGEFLVYPAFLFFSVSLAALAITIATAFFLFYLCRFEEKLLVLRFGEDYLHYMKDVPMLFPRLFKSK